MGRRKVIKAEKKVCQKCKVEKSLLKFYITNSKMFPDGRVGICNDCVKDMIDVNDVETLKDVLRAVDKPFVRSLWDGCLKSTDPAASYFRQISSLPQFSSLCWNDSGAQGSKLKEKTPQVGRDFSGGILEDDSGENGEVEISKELYKKWGRGFKPIEILEFEDKYEILSNSYQVKTELHKEFLKKACIASVKMDKAIAKGDAKEAQQFSTIFKDMTSAGKLQPNQMSKADLSEGGLDTFGQLAREVEKTVDIIPILPQFKERPSDKADFTIWCYVNYIRNLQNLPTVEYRDVYNYYEQRKLDWEKQLAEQEADNNVN